VELAFYNLSNAFFSLSHSAKDALPGFTGDKFSLGYWVMSELWIGLQYHLSFNFWVLNERKDFHHPHSPLLLPIKNR
jgi:hypothetical protein